MFSRSTSRQQGLRMSFRSKRTFVDVQQSVEQSSTLEYNIDKTNSPKLAKGSVTVSNRWGPFSPSTLRPTNAPQFKIASKSSTAPLPFHNPSYAPSKEILHDITRPMIVKPRLSSMLQSSTIVVNHHKEDCKINVLDLSRLVKHHKNLFTLLKFLKPLPFFLCSILHHLLLK